MPFAQDDLVALQLPPDLPPTWYVPDIEPPETLPE
jgi:hypothetical protein